MNRLVKKCKKKQNYESFLLKYSVFIIAVLLVTIGSLLYPQFMSVRNLMNVARQVSFNGLLAIGMTFVILTGGIDLSVGSVLALASVGASYVQNLPLALMVGSILLICTLAGFLNGVIITKLKIAPFIVTLASMKAFRGICYLLTDGGITRNISNESFIELGRHNILGFFPMSFFVLLLMLIVASVVLRYTSFGRSVYAVGGNFEAAKLIGLPVNKIRIAAYTISGFLAGCAGLLVAARMASGEPVAGEGFEMNAISAVVLGGALLTGGKGNVVFSVVGAIVLGLISNLMNMQGNMSAPIQNVIMGLLLLIIVVSQTFMFGEKSRKVTT